MKYAVLLYSERPNPLGFPPEYPAETRQVEDSFVVESPWVEMTASELVNRINQYKYQVEAIAAAKEAVPSEVALWQFRAALKIAGLFDQVIAAVGALPNQQRIVIEQQLEYGNVIHRTHPTIGAMALALGITSDQVDDVFKTAASLQ